VYMCFIRLTWQQLGRNLRGNPLTQKEDLFQSARWCEEKWGSGRMPGDSMV